jgi:hypothetical protein
MDEQSQMDGGVAVLLAVGFQLSMIRQAVRQSNVSA